MSTLLSSDVLGYFTCYVGSCYGAGCHRIKQEGANGLPLPEMGIRTGRRLLEEVQTRRVRERFRSWVNLRRVRSKSGLSAR